MMDGVTVAVNTSVQFSSSESNHNIKVSSANYAKLIVFCLILDYGHYSTRYDDQQRSPVMRCLPGLRPTRDRVGLRPTRDPAGLRATPDRAVMAVRAFLHEWMGKCWRR